MSTEKKGLFEKLYGAGKEVLDAINKPLVRKALKRKLASAFDDTIKRIATSEKELSKLRADFENYDVNAILKHRQEINDCLLIQADLKAEYKELFDAEMKIEDEE